MPFDSIGDTGLTVEIGSSFSREDAARIHEVIANAAPGTTVELDFHAVRDCHDVALAALAQDLLDGHAHVQLRGMSQHQLRLLGYLGVTDAGAI